MSNGKLLPPCKSETYFQVFKNVKEIHIFCIPRMAWATHNRLVPPASSSRAKMSRWIRLWGCRGLQYPTRYEWCLIKAHFLCNHTICTVKTNLQLKTHILPGTVLLVLDRLFWAEQPCGRGLLRLQPSRLCGWLHQSLSVQQQSLLSGSAVQRQQEFYHREHQKAHWKGWVL